MSTDLNNNMPAPVLPTPGENPSTHGQSLIKNDKTVCNWADGGSDTINGHTGQHGGSDSARFYAEQRALLRKVRP
jgi:hypothetical protein